MRSEIIIFIQVNVEHSKKQQNVFIHSLQELSEDLLCGNTMNIVKDRQIFIDVLNPTKKVQVITIPKLSELSHEIS